MSASTFIATLGLHRRLWLAGVGLRRAFNNSGASGGASRLPLFGRRSTLADASTLRPEVCPPSLCHAPSRAWDRLLFWLLAPAPHKAAPPLARLGLVRADFLAQLADIGTRHDADATDLRQRLDGARSLRELWHLRTAVFHLIGVAHSQAEAEQRLARLNRHFPTRAPRSGFTPL